MILVILVASFSCRTNQKDSPEALKAAVENKNKEVIQSFVNGLNQPDWYEKVGSVLNQKDFEEYRKVHSEFRKAFPDYHNAVEIMLAKGDTVITIGTITVTHQGEFSGRPFKGLAPTGKKLKWKEVWINTVKDGKIVSGEMIANQLEILDQLGISCPPAEVNQ